ncbi:MAG: DUF554 domain-containing protein [Intestinibacillus sp.]
MPVGILVNICSVLLGGLLGTILRAVVPQFLKDNLPLYCGIMSFVIGTATMRDLKTMAAVVGALLLGAIIGELLHLEKRLNVVGAHAQKAVTRIMPRLSGGDNADINMLIGVIILFVFNGSGFFGALNEGMTGDGSFLMAKSVLDFVTAVAFATTLGIIVSLLAAPQAVILLILFACAGLIVPHATPTMIADFSACGGAIMFFTGFRIAKIKDIPVTNFLPALVLVMPFSYLLNL